ncbi:MAG: YigZ family protein [Anaerolineae bacterium]
MATGYLIPAQTFRAEIVVVNSRFITSIGYAPTVDDARAFLSAVRAEMHDASHNIYAYRVGYGNSVIESMGDDGEPSGTAGPPALAVLRGVDIGDTIVVITRYFGGTLLGTGGLVRAYTEAAQVGLAGVPKERKIERKIVGLDTPYSFYQPIRRLYEQFEATSVEEDFAGDITITAKFPVDNIDGFTAEVIELTAGHVHPVILE